MSTQSSPFARRFGASLTVALVAATLGACGGSSSGPEPDPAPAPTPTAVNQAPLPAFSATPTGLAVQVTDTGSADPDGSIAMLAWDFGEPGSGTNTATGATASHLYAAPGTYAITLTATDNRGLTATRVQNVTVAAAQNATPVAAFTVDATNPPVVAVDASASSDGDGTIVGYQWNFGEAGSASNTATGAAASHTYAATGTYTVSLTVTDDQGATNTTTNNVTITSTTVVGSGSLQFRLDWSRTGDLDIVVALPDGKLIQAYSTGPSAATDFGLLDNDSHGVGPENVYWPDNVTPPSGNYDVCGITWTFLPVVSPADPLTATLVVRRPNVAPQTLTRTYTAPVPHGLADYQSCTPSSPGYLGTFTMP